MESTTETAETQDRLNRKRKFGNNVLSLFLVQCLDGARPAKQMPISDSNDDGLIPQFKETKKKTDDGSKSKFNYNAPARGTIVRSQGSYLYDREGNCYLDSVSGVSHVGHCHPRITQTVQFQLACFGTGVPINPNQIPEGPWRATNYSKRLLKNLPKKFDTVLFFASGSQANDIAVQMARAHTGNYDVVVFEEGFHGSLGVVSDVSHKIISRGGMIQKPWVHVLPIPDTIRGPYSTNDPNAYEKYFRDAKKVLDDAVRSGRKIACLLTEPVFTFHSIMIPPAKYFQNICNYIRKIGGLIIIDEVQTGLGRLGDCTWGFELHDIMPDIITSGKPLGNGHPLAVTISSEKLANGLGMMKDLYQPTMTQEAIGNAVLDIMENEGLQVNAFQVGDILTDQLKKLMLRYPYIGGIHGSGLLIGIEFVWDRKEMIPSKEIAELVLYQMREHRIITAVEGKYHNIMFLIPPMCFSKEDAKRFLTTLETIMDDIGPLKHDEIVEKLDQASERFSSWNNIPDDYLTSCSARSENNPAGDPLNVATEVLIQQEVVEEEDESSSESETEEEKEEEEEVEPDYDVPD